MSDIRVECCNPIGHIAFGEVVDRIISGSCPIFKIPEREWRTPRPGTLFVFSDEGPAIREWTADDEAANPGRATCLVCRAARRASSAGPSE